MDTQPQNQLSTLPVEMTTQPPGSDGETASPVPASCDCIPTGDAIPCKECCQGGYNVVVDMKPVETLTPPSKPTTDPLLADVSLPTAAGPLALVVAAAMGAAFGFAIQKGRVYEPHYITEQLEMRKFLMLKMFLSAAATSLLVTSLLSLTQMGRSRVAGARKWAFCGYRGAAAAIVGGMVLGAGMALSGSCPGTGPVQMGAGVVPAIVTVIGGLIGGLVFALIEPRILKPSGLLQAWSFSTGTFDATFGLPFWAIGIGMALMMGGATAGFEAAFPWRSELPDGVDTSVGFKAYAWPPYVSGIIIGCLQLPGLLLVKDTIGSSRAYVTVIAQIGKFKQLKRVSGWFSNPYFCGCAGGIGNYQQLIHVVASVGGSALAAWLGGSLGDVEGFNYAYSFFGGFLTVFGGRLAGGCTSGQGISGNAVLGLISPLATASMFAGGIAIRGVIVMFSR